MSQRAMGILAALWVLSLVAVSTIVQAQVFRIEPVIPSVIAGPDFGFRMEGTQNGVPVGLPVVQIEGEWVPVRFGSRDGQTNLLR